MFLCCVFALWGFCCCFGFGVLVCLVVVFLNNKNKAKLLADHVPLAQEGAYAVFVSAFPLLNQLLEFFVMLLAKNCNVRFDTLTLKSS